MAFGYITADQVIPNSNSKAEDWISWYALLPGSTSTKNAIWLQAWGEYAGPDANTSDLRSSMKANAGIDITTDGIGSIVDATKSVIDSVEDLAMVPLYLLAGGAFLIFGVGGFMVYEGVKNPEATEEIIGKAAMMAQGGSMPVIDNNNQQYWLYGAGGLTISVLAVLFYVRYQNQIVVNNIMAAIGTSKTVDPVTHDPITAAGSGSKATGTLTDLGNSDIFDPSWWRNDPSKVTIVALNGDGTSGTAQIFADRIWAAKSTDIGNAYHPADVVAVFKQLTSKQDVSKLADVFAGKYKTDLYNFLNDSWMTNDCDPTEDTCYSRYSLLDFGKETNYLKQVYDWITNHLT